MSSAVVEVEEIPISSAAICFDPLLRMLASSVDDLEGIRKATENRLRGMTRTEPDEDGIVRGLGLSPSNAFVVASDALLASVVASEKMAIQQLEKAMKRHPLGEWVQKTPGVGLKQGARLIAAIGDPYWHLRDNRPRTVSQLWAYAGYHTIPAEGGSVAARRKKGVQSNWSSDAKTRAYLVAQSCLKAVGSETRRRSPYRDVYDVRKAYTHAVHPEWSDGHCHNDALRITAKSILKDLWREARRIHGVEDPEPVPE